MQEERYRSHAGIHCNAQMTERMIHQYAEPDADGIELLRMAMRRLSLSARAYNRILKVARTIADLAGSEKVAAEHLGEAIGYRNLDRGDWAEQGAVMRTAGGAHRGLLLASCGLQPPARRQGFRAIANRQRHRL